MAKNESHWGSRTKPTQTRGVNEIDDKAAQDEKYEVLTKQVSLLMSERASSSSKPVMNCENCGGHNINQCPISVPEAASVDHVDYVNQGKKFQGNPYSGTCNRSWRNHQNFH